MTRNARHSRWQFFVFALCACLAMALSSGCSTRPRVTIEGTTPARFKIAGQENIQMLTVSGPDFDNPHSSDPGSRYMKPFWQIVADGSPEGASLAQIGDIAYGKVPEGFKQVFPKNGATPPPLLENELFTLECRFADGEAVGTRFVIKNGAASIEGS